MQRGWTAAVAAAVVLFASNDGRAHDDKWPHDFPNKTWLESLHRPDNAQHPYRRDQSLLCCGAADLVTTQFRVEYAGGPHPDDRWFAWVGNEWIKIPPEKIVADHSPDGRPYLFMLAGTVQCFVRPKGGL
jgi:hypothetical protein